MRKLMLALLLVSCGEGVAPVLIDGSEEVVVPVPPTAPTLASRLAEGAQLFIGPNQAGGFIEARQIPMPFELVTLKVTGGAIWLSGIPDCTTKARLDWMQLRFADVPLFDSGVMLTDLRATAEPALVAIEDARLNTTLVISGSWRVPGQASVPFEPLRFENVPIMLSLMLNDAGLVDGHFRLVNREVPSFRFDGILETGAAQLEGLATQASPMTPIDAAR